MADLFREVDEIMRQERLTQLWKDYGVYLIGFIAGTILLTAIISGYKSWDTSVKERQTSALIALQQAEDYPENILNAEKLDLRGGLRGALLLNAARDALNNKDDEKAEEKALTLYTRAAEDKDIPSDLRHLAILMNVRLISDKEGQDAQTLLKQLEPVWKKSKSPWAAHGRVEAAVITANMLEDYETAREHLNTVQDTPGLPDTLYARARSLNHLYSLKQKEKEQQDKPNG